MYLTYPLVYLYSEQSSSCPEVTPLVVTPLVFIGLPVSLSSYIDTVRLNLLLKDSEFLDGAGSAATATEDDLDFFKIYFRPEIEMLTPDLADLFSERAEVLDVPDLSSSR